MGQHQSERDTLSRCVSAHHASEFQIWKTFFEAAAGIRLAPEQPYFDEGNTERAGDDDDDDDGEDDQTVLAAGDNDNGPDADEDEQGDVTTELPSDNNRNRVKGASIHDEHGQKQSTAHRVVSPPAWADQASPFEQLRQDIEKVKITDASDASYASSAFVPPVLKSAGFATAPAKTESGSGSGSAAGAASRSQTRLRDLSMDSPDIERPTLETTTYAKPRNSRLPQIPADVKGKAREQEAQDCRNHRENPSPFFRPNAADSQSTPSTAGSSFDLSSLEPPSSARPSMPQRQSSGNTAKKKALLQKVLTKNLVGKDGHPNASTPARRSVGLGKLAAEDSGGSDFFPTDLPSGWNGIADLSKTPLSSFDSPQKSTISRFSAASSEQPGGKPMPQSASSSIATIDSPAQPRTGALEYDASASFADFIRKFNPPANSLAMSRLSKTPAKEAARLVTRDVLKDAVLRSGGAQLGMDSPGNFSAELDLEPPSVLKNWATRGYTTQGIAAEQSQQQHGQSPSFADSPAHMSRTMQQQQPLQMLATEDEDLEDSFEAEFDAGPPPQPNFRHLADEGDELGLSQGAGIGTSQVQQHTDRPAGGDDWEDSFDGRDEEGASFEDNQPAAGHYNDQEVPLKDEGDSFDSNASRSSGGGEEETLFGAQRQNRESEAFRLNGPDDMVTLHGGQLLESQPFEASPLAGRDARYGL